jgi:hypothetical protein
MSEDIKFKLEANESGAVAAFKRFRTEVVNNEQALGKMGREGKLTGRAIKDLGGLAGQAGLGQLGHAIDKLSGGMGDFNKSTLLAKAGLVGLVATAGVSIGKMIGEWVFDTQQWVDLVDKAISSMEKLNQGAVQSARKRAGGMDAADILKELKGIDEALTRATEKRRKFDNAINLPLIGMTGEAKESIKLLDSQIKQQRELREVWMAALQERKKETSEEFLLNKEKEKQELELARQKEKARMEEESLLLLQEKTLDNLQLEIVRLREGEEAYTRLSLAKQGFTQDTIDAAVAMKAEIEALKELNKPAREEKQRQDRSTSPLQAQQQRFLTRGVSVDPNMKVAENTKQTAKTLWGLKEEATKAHQRAARFYEWFERQLTVEN